MKKTSWKTQVDFTRISSSSLLEKEQIYTISKIQKEEIVADAGRVAKVPLCYFKETEMPMVLNKTNMKILERLFQSEYIEDWYGKQITVFVKEGIKFGKELVSGLRIKGAKQVKIIPCNECGAIITKTTKNTIDALILIGQEKYKQNLCAKCLGQKQKMAE
jgi:hypothetical protein